MGKSGKIDRLQPKPGHSHPRSCQLADSKDQDQVLTCAFRTVSNAGRIKYAQPQDLPSFPSAGLSSGDAAASAAASLGWANQKSPEIWQPEKISSASAAAALLAKDTKSAAGWRPGSASDGASKAALLAVGSADAALRASSSASGQIDKSVSQDKWGNSAATQAFSAARGSSSDNADLAGGSSAANQAFHAKRASQHVVEPVTLSHDDSDRSLAAAKGAMSGSKRSSYMVPPSQSEENRRLETSAAASALNGAALAHRNSLMAKAPIEDVGAVPVTTMTRNMFTSHPPVKPEVDEKANNERLHQTAVEMARKMYSQQQKMLNQTKEHHEETTTPYAGTYLNLQDAAFKQAQERLAKLHDEHQQGRDVQEYYGNKPTTSPRRKFSITNKLRRRGSDDSLDDRARSQKIKEQMSMFSTKLSQVDKEKRDKDREALLAAAQRNVKARLQGMDEKVQKSGKRKPSKLTDFELKAQQAAQSRVDSSNVNKGKIDIGGGKFMDPEEINAIAAKRLQPMLDNITEKAETERARVAALKVEEDARREELEKQKARDREEKDASRRQKELEKAEEKTKRDLAKAEERAKKQQLKDEEKSRKAAEKEEEKARKAAKAEGERAAKEEKRKSKLPAMVPVPEPVAATEASKEETAAEAEDNEEFYEVEENIHHGEAAEDKDHVDHEEHEHHEHHVEREEDHEENHEERHEELEVGKAEKHHDHTDLKAVAAADESSLAPAVATEGPDATDEADERALAAAIATGGPGAVPSTADTEQASNRNASADESGASPKRKSTVRGWIKNRFSRNMSVMDKDPSDKRRSIFGSQNKSDNRDPAEKRESVSHGADAHSEAAEHEADSRGVSPISTPTPGVAKKLEESAAEHNSAEKPEEKIEEVKAKEKALLELPHPVDETGDQVSIHSNRDSRFREEI